MVIEGFGNLGSELVHYKLVCVQEGTLHTACYLVNRSPSSVLGDKTPQEVWTGKEPSLTHLKVFGCDAYVHVPKENRSKMDKKAEKMYLYWI